MIDVNSLLRTWLLTDSINGAQNGLPAILGTPPLIFAGHLPQGSDPSQRPIIVVRVGGGTPSISGGGTAYLELPVISPRMQITAWAGVDQFSVARSVYRAAYDWLQAKNNIDLGDAGFVLSMREMTEGQDVSDPHTGLATCVSYWGLTAREN